MSEGLPEEVVEAQQKIAEAKSRMEAQHRMPRAGHFIMVEETVIGEVQKYILTTPTGPYTVQEAQSLAAALGAGKQVEGGNGA